jgi:hypothetical protein
MTGHHHDFFGRLARILNADQARSVIVCGNVHDLFWTGSRFAPLPVYLCEKCATPRLIRIVYELNGPLRIADEPKRLRDAWIAWKAGQSLDTLVLHELRGKGRSQLERFGEEFDRLLGEAIGNPTLALEVLRQLTICSRTSGLAGDLLILIEAADMLLPAAGGDVASLSDRQLHRISIVHDWFSDPAFIEGRDSVVLLAESRAAVHPRVARLPQVLSVEVPPPDAADRRHFIDTFCEAAAADEKLFSLAPPDQGSTAGRIENSRHLASLTAGLSLHAVRQLLAGAAYGDEPLTPAQVVDKVEEFIQGQLGEDVIEFKKPTHRLDDVVGFSRLKRFLRDELIPRLLAPADRALAGAAIAGPIGGGKTFIFEAVAGELGVPVLVLKNIRSQWFGQTDVLFERLRRLIEALERVVIFVDEADTQFGGLGADVHETERRLTGRIQAMMSDPRLRGKVAWLLMTARIHLLSPDLRRPGRVGDLIIPVLDPEGQDRRDFLRWVLAGVLESVDEAAINRLDALTPGYSAAAFSSLRSSLRSARPSDIDEVAGVAADQLQPAIAATRRYQTLQALVNCTRRSLLPHPDVTPQQRETWSAEIRVLEAAGVR